MLNSPPPSRSYPPWIAIAVVMAMLAAGCGGSSPAARPTETTSRVDAGTTTLSPQPSPPSPARVGSLAYGVDGDIYVADWDGSNAVRIADGRPPTECGGGSGEYWGEGPIWSPDGRYLAYRHANCDASKEAWSRVVISDPKGNLVAEFPGVRGWDISWSPDSTRVAVWVRFGETIGVFGIDGERKALRAMPRGWSVAGDHDPIWLPDGRSLLMQGVVVPVDGSTPYRLRPARGTPSPDGSRTAYATRKSLVIARADGSNRRTVFDGMAYEPLWSPTGDRIAFTTWKPGTGAELRVLDVATGTVRLLAEADGLVLLQAIDFSPEGDRIQFARMPNGPIDKGSLWSVDTDVPAPHRLVAVTSWGDWLSPGPTP